MSIDIIICQATTNEIFPQSSERGLLGLRHGALPHVGDAMELFDIP